MLIKIQEEKKAIQKDVTLTNKQQAKTMRDGPVKGGILKRCARRTLNLHQSDQYEKTILFFH